MSENAQRQFSINYAFALTAVVAVGVVAFLEFQRQIGTSIAIAFSIWTATMAFLFVQVLFRVRTRPIWRTSIGITIFLLGLIPIFFPSTILPDYDLRVRSFANSNTINEQLDRVIASIDDPEAVLAASRELHQALMELPESERRINGDSDLIPPILSKMQPIAIYASKNVLQLQLIRNYEKCYSLYAYPENSNSSPVGTQRIIDGLWWWRIEF